MTRRVLERDLTLDYEHRHAERKQLGIPQAGDVSRGVEGIAEENATDGLSQLTVTLLLLPLLKQLRGERRGDASAV